MFQADTLLKNEIVSRETIEKLKIYQRLLEKWQQKINLIASSTLPQAWQRHFEDSLQLLNYFPKPASGTFQNLIDLGSGAGFPGLVLAIACPHTLKVTLVESNFKKCVFLENVSRETFSPVNIIKGRIENLPAVLKFDVITARGLAPLDRLLDYAEPLIKETSVCLFLKGKEVDKEIAESEKKWKFDLALFQSLTDSSARILKITSPKRIS